MAVRLSALFEGHIQRIIQNWKNKDDSKVSTLRLRKKRSELNILSDNNDSSDNSESSFEEIKSFDSDEETSSSSDETDHNSLADLKRSIKKDKNKNVNTSSDSSVTNVSTKRRTRVINSDEDSDQDSDQKSNNYLLSVSSRGRVRKLSARVNAILKKK